MIDAEAQATLRPTSSRCARARATLLDLPLTAKPMRAAPMSSPGHLRDPVPRHADARGVRADPACGALSRATGWRRCCDAINATGYGLTLGLHSRIEATAEFVAGAGQGRQRLRQPQPDRRRGGGAAFRRRRPVRHRAEGRRAALPRALCRRARALHRSRPLPAAMRACLPRALTGLDPSCAGRIAGRRRRVHFSSGRNWTWLDGRRVENARSPRGRARRRSVPSSSR